jgi:hypothetical protein
MPNALAPTHGQQGGATDLADEHEGCPHVHDDEDGEDVLYI